MSDNRRTARKQRLLVLDVTTGTKPTIKSFKPNFGRVVGIDVNITAPGLLDGDPKAIAHVVVSQGEHNRYAQTVYREDLSGKDFDTCRCKFCPTDWEENCNDIRVTVHNQYTPFPGDYKVKVYLLVE